MSWIQTRRRAQEAPAGRSMEDTLRRQMAWAAGTEQFQHRDPLYHVTESFQQTFDAMGRRHAAQLSPQEQAPGQAPPGEQAQGREETPDPTSARSFYERDRPENQDMLRRFSETAFQRGTLSGAVLRGNDVLKGTPDVLICDSLTGNVLVKMLSAYTTGGSFEATGYGYGPGIGPGYDKLVLIVSRASGAPLVANALEFGAQLVKGKVFEIAEKEFAAAEKAGLSKLLADRKAAAKGAAADEEEVKAPPAEPCTASIPGIEVMDLEDAAKVLWKAGIYAETGMGCTGPLVMMSDANYPKAVELLKAAGYIG